MSKGKGVSEVTAEESQAAASSGEAVVHELSAEEQWIFSVNTQQTVEVEALETNCEILIDSGPEIHVCPPWFRQDVPITPAPSLVIRSAGGHQLEHLGERQVDLRTTSGAKLRITFQVATVRRPILSVKRLTEKGYEVHFAHDGGSCIVSPRKGKLALAQKGGMYMLAV
eukprot:5628644-Amphidinium_carterae.1